MRHPRYSAFLAIVVAGLHLTCLCSRLDATDEPSPERPNILLINLDDADREMLKPEILAERFPAIDSLAKRGITFTNFHITSPRCASSRGCLLRGQYAHAIDQRVTNAGSKTSRGFKGDYSAFVEQGYIHDEMGAWMKDAGYHTVFVGKYHNPITGKLASILPQGWNEFYSSLGARYYETYRYTNRNFANGAWEQIPAGEYRTNVEAADMDRIIRNHESTTEPLFLYFAPFGPHDEGRSAGGMIDVDADDERWQDIVETKLEDFDEEDFSDKPAAYQHIPRLRESDLGMIARAYRDRMLATLSVDRAIAKILKALEETGRLDNTFIFLTTDNGYSLGEHRLQGKGNSMTRSAHVPLIVCGPGIGYLASANHLLGHIDLAPTFLDIAGADAKPFFDGKSLKPILSDPFLYNEVLWRESLLIENWDKQNSFGISLKTTFSQLRMYDSIYTEWADGSREYYELDSDPLELVNAFDALPDIAVETLSSQLKALRRPIPEPLATIETPFKFGDSVAGLPFVVGGIAEASSGVDRVQLVILKWSTREYWNGTAWQTSRATVPTSLSNQDGIQTEWSYSFAPPPPENPREGYSIYPRTYSTTGEYTGKLDFKGFRHDTEDPETDISEAVLSVGPQTLVMGLAEDNLAVKNVRIHLQNLITGEYYDGASWTDKNVSTFVEVGDNDIWEFLTPELAPGSYQVRARAYDRAGNYDRTPAFFRLDIE